MQIFKILGIIAAVVIGSIGLTGMYKFNHLANQPGYNVDGNKIQEGVAGQETIYYSEVFKEWRDDIGVCNTCTPENGFGTDGTVDNIAWRELWLDLKNDTNENPPIDEVRELFKNHYAESSGYYPVRVSELKGQFIVHIPVPKELKDIDFFDQQGALLATYNYPTP